MLYTRDKVNIAYEYIKESRKSIVIICPGFFNSKSNRWMRKTVDLISEEYDIIIFDFRGHGDSGGKFSWLAKEHFDLEAVLDYAKRQGYKQIAIVAFSLGAAVAINAISKRKDVTSMVLISCPLSFWKIDYHFWEPGMFWDLKDNIECNWEGKGSRTTNLFIPKPKPIKMISKIDTTAILFIHGDSDWIIKDYHSKRLYEQTQTYKKLEIIEKGLHAERLIQQYPNEMKRLLHGWFSDTIK